MKKILAFLFAISLCASIFAYDDDEFWINNRNVGIDAPIIMPSFDAMESGVSNFGVGWSYKQQHIYWPNGFVFQFTASEGVLMKQDFCYENSFHIGFGVAFASNKKAVVTLASIIGSYNSVLVGYDSNSVDYAITSSFIIGLDFSATVRFSENLGFFISALVETPLIGATFWGAASNVHGNIYAEAGTKILTPGDFFYIKPSIGLSITFGE